jgi:tryptophan 2,3-dioxygenase
MTDQREGRTLTEYEQYIRTEELFALQKPAEERLNPDELLFQVVHQTAELWMKLARNECERAAHHLERDEPFAAGALLKRVGMILKLLSDQLPILETMPPQSYHAIRMGLGRGSGQDSPGFNRILEEVPPRLWPAFEGALTRQSLTLLDLHRGHHEHPGLFAALSGMLDLDENFQKFRYNHFSLVRRVIGDQVKSLKGIPASMLDRGTRAPLFPPLWEVVNELTREWRPEY